MKLIKIQNDGLLDIRLVSLMGGTTKEGQDNKIGFFGTGLKYTLAYMMRKGLKLHIFIGEDEVELSTQTEIISEVEFKILYIDGQRSAITDKMGRDWKPWMIIRECWSNAIDEGGQIREITEEAKGEAGKTTFYFELDVDFNNVWNNWNKYFINDFVPLYVGKDFSIYAGSDKPRIYKQGVLVKELEHGMPSVFNYDFRNARLNELRELLDTPSYIIYRCLQQVTDPKIITYFMENVNDTTFEGTMDWDWTFSCGELGQAWGDTIGNAKIIHPEAAKNIKARGLEIDTAGTIEVPERIFKHLTKTFEGIGAIRVANKVHEFYEVWDEALDLRLKEALAILDKCGYYMHPELKFIYGDFGDKLVLAKVDMDKKEILVSTKMMSQSLFRVVTMLIEENEHFNTSHDDCTREFQQHFIDLFANTMLAKNEIKL